MVISETTVRPMAALWHPCHRGIRESIHIRLGGRASTDGLAARRRANTMVRLSIFNALLSQSMLRVIEQIPLFTFQCCISLYYLSTLLKKLWVLASLGRVNNSSGILDSTT